MGGRGARIKGVGSSAGQNLNKAINAQEKKVNTLSDKVAELSRYALPSYTGADKNKKSAEYYKALRSFNTERSKLNDLKRKKTEIEREKVKSQSSENYVNGYGEATERDITSSIWEREKKRRKKAVDSFMSGRR